MDCYNYYLPLRFATLELEFTIVSDRNEPIVVPQGDAGANPNTETDKQGYYFQGGNTSVLWEINKIMLLFVLKILHWTIPWISISQNACYKDRV